MHWNTGAEVRMLSTRSKKVLVKYARQHSYRFGDRLHKNRL